jgi:hypothetical protein
MVAGVGHPVACVGAQGTLVTEGCHVVRELVVILGGAAGGLAFHGGGRRCGERGEQPRKCGRAGNGSGWGWQLHGLEHICACDESVRSLPDERADEFLKRNVVIAFPELHSSIHGAGHGAGCAGLTSSGKCPRSGQDPSNASLCG